MDGLSALSIAVAIAQFIDFGSKLISTSVSSYKSPNGIIGQLNDHKFVTEQLQGLVDRLTCSNEPIFEGGHKEEQEIRAICVECGRIATELLEEVKKISGNDSPNVSKSTKDKGLHKKRNAIGQGLRYLWNEDRVNDLSIRLGIFRQELSPYVVSVKVYNASASEILLLMIFQPPGR